MTLTISTTEGPRGESHSGLSCTATVSAAKVVSPGGSISLQLPINEIQANAELSKVLESGQFWMIEGKGFRRRFFLEKVIGNITFLADDGTAG